MVIKLWMLSLFISYSIVMFKGDSIRNIPFLKVLVCNELTGMRMKRK